MVFKLVQWLPVLVSSEPVHDQNKGFEKSLVVGRPWLHVGEVDQVLFGQLLCCTRGLALDFCQLALHAAGEDRSEGLPGEPRRRLAEVRHPCCEGRFR